MAESESPHAPPGALLIATAIAVLAIAGLVITAGPSNSGALTLQDQATYEIGIDAYQTCDPQTNPFIETPNDRDACCTGQCFTPCLTNGIPGCLENCKAVCGQRPAYHR